MILFYFPLNSPENSKWSQKMKMFNEELFIKNPQEEPKLLEMRDRSSGTLGSDRAENTHLWGKTWKTILRISKVMGDKAET